MLHCIVDFFSITPNYPSEKKSTLPDVSRLKTRYLRQQPTSQTDWPKHNVSEYVKLVLIEKEKVIHKDKDLHKAIKLSQDKKLTKKQPINDLEDIFFYQNKCCPRLILIIGGAGKHSDCY